MHLRIVLRWEYFHSHQPDTRVAKALGFGLDGVRSHSEDEDEASVMLRAWLPNTPI